MTLRKPTSRYKRKTRPLMPYLQLLDYIKTRFGYEKFVSGALVQRLREDYPLSDREYVMSFTGSGLMWLTKKGLAERDNDRPVKWNLIQVEEDEPVEASEHGCYIVDVADYEVLVKSVEPHKHKIKVLISSEAHTIRTRLLAAALAVPFRILPASAIATHRVGRWFVPPHI